MGLAAQGQIRAAATAGRLSPEQAGAVTDAVTVNPDAEAGLLEEAGRSSLGELRRAAAARKAECQDLEQIEARIHARRRLRRWRDAEGAEHLQATGTRLDLAIIDQALRKLIDERFRAARADGEREPLDAYAFDALARRHLDGTNHAPGDATGDGAAGGAGTGKRRDPIRHLAILRADLPALVRGHVEAGETCEVAGLGPVSVAAAREMLGEAVLKLVLTNGVEVRNVTHVGRGPNTAQKLALLWEQPVCSREGCGRRARLEYDHIDDHEYRLTHHTRVDELAPLCDPDHDLKTLHGWALVEGTGVRPMVPPDDPRHPRHQRTRAP
jgi:hypothetical protein